MKRTINLLIIGLNSLSIVAQEQWTMNRCISYAIEHANSVRKQRIEIRQSRYDMTTAGLDFLPTISAQLSGQYSWGRNIDPETNTYNTITTFNNYYSIGAEMRLFDGGRTFNAFRQARLARLNSETALQKAADDKAVVVMTKFIEAVYHQKSIGLASRKLADSKALLHKTRSLFELGEKSRPDVVQIESQVAEDDYNLLHQQNAAQSALLALKSEMNFPVEDLLELDTSVVSCPISTDDAGHIYERFGSESPDVKLAVFKAENARYTYLIQRGLLLPSLSLSGGISTNYYRNLSQKTKRGEVFGRQFHNNIGEYIYLQLSIPIFAPSRWRTVHRAKSDWLEAQLVLEDTKQKLNADIVQAVSDRDGCVREIVKMEKKVESDSLAYRLSVRKYEEGMLSAFDLHTAAQTLLESRIKLLQIQLTLEMKIRLVNYYKGNRLWTLK